MTSERQTSVDELLDQLLARHRAGEALNVEAVCHDYPEYAEEIREALPAMLLMEDAHCAALHRVDAPAAAPAPHLGGYRILHELGRGGMGVVYEAVQESLGRRVALKILPPGWLGDERAARRFHREARAAAQMHHTNIVPVFEVAEDHGTHFYAMQLIHGQSLDHVIDDLARLRAESGVPGLPRPATGADQRDGLEDEQASGIAASLWGGHLEPQQLVGAASSSGEEPAVPAATTASETDRRALPRGSDVLSSSGSHHSQYWRSAAHIGRQVADALAYSHARGVIHRDIKPSNLILDECGVVWVTDFGLAMNEEDRLTRTGDVLGTLRYMPPEQLQGNCDERSDIYSLGLTLYELLVLRPAFPASDRLKLVELIRHKQPTAPRALDRRIPRDLETIVLKACEKDPGSRYRSARELAEDLRRFIDNEPIQARRASWPERLARWSVRNRALAASLAASFLLLSVIAVGSAWAAYYFRKQQRIQQTLAGERESESLRAQAAEQVAESTLYAAQMRLAGEALHGPGGIDRVLDLTDRWKPSAAERDRRGWEWYLLKSLCQRERLSLDADEGLAWSVDWHPDGNRFASSGSSGLIRVWDAETGRELKRFQAPGQAYSVRWSPDGTRLGVGHGHEVGVWDVEAASQLVRVRDAHAGVVRRVTWSPNGQRLASAAEDGTAKVWDARSGEQLVEYTGHPHMVFAVAWNPAGTLIASGGEDQDIHVWNAATGRLESRLVRHTSAVRSIRWSPDGKRLASANDDQSVKVWDLERHLHSFESPRPVLSVDWDPAGRRLATGHWDGTVRVIDLDALREVLQFAGHADRVWDVCWSPDGQEILSASIDGTVKVWNTSPADGSRAVAAGGRAFDKVAWSPDGSRLAVSSGPQILVWEAGEETPLMFKAHTEQLSNLCWSPDGSRLASATHHDPPKVWDAVTGAIRLKFDEEDADGFAVAWSPDGRQLATAHGDKIQLRHAETGKVHLSLRGHSGRIRTLDWRPDSKRLAAAGEDGPLWIWDVADGRCLGSLPGHVDGVSCVRWSPDGMSLASCSLDHTVRVWDAPSSTERFILRGHTRPVHSVRWNHDGTRLASGGVDAIVRVWNTVTGDETLALASHRAHVQGVDWSADGTRLASASWDGTVQIWDATHAYATSNE